MLNGRTMRLRISSRYLFSINKMHLCKLSIAYTTTMGHSYHNTDTHCLPSAWYKVICHLSKMQHVIQWEIAHSSRLRWHTLFRSRPLSCRRAQQRSKQLTTDSWGPHTYTCHTYFLCFWIYLWNSYVTSIEIVLEVHYLSYEIVEVACLYLYCKETLAEQSFSFVRSRRIPGSRSMFTIWYGE